ncbi:MAG: hypothetical protein IKG21_12805 [Atopobiaceae bacterium]|nr:hypothetical protein [Atopobiaceae bacterium]
MAEKRRLGSVQRMPNGRWRARIQSGVKSDGMPRRVSAAFDTEAQAESWLVETAHELGRRPDLDAGMTLQALWRLYEKDKGARLSVKTMSAYRSQMRTWLRAFGDADISRITPPMVQRELSHMTHENALHAKRALSSALTYAVTVGLLAANPLHGHKFDIPDAAPRDYDFDDDPFAAIEDARDVWDVSQVLECMELIRGLPLEPAWLACVGAGLRVEEALALRRIDVRRVEVAGVQVTQLAVHHASTAMERRKATKTRQSVRVVAMLEPFGTRYWELAQRVDGKDAVCALSASRQNKAWRNYFAEPCTSKHTPKSKATRGALRRLDEYGNPTLPYLPLARMRNTHATLMQQAGVLDSINAAMHGHSERVAQRHYLRPDTTAATVDAARRLRLVG